MKRNRGALSRRRLQHEILDEVRSRWSLTAAEVLISPNKVHRSTAYRVNRCLICADPAIDATTDGRFVTTACPNCLAVLAIEFDPPDQPELRARIERLDEFDNGGTGACRCRSLRAV
jgi:hypothetical protein